MLASEELGKALVPVPERKVSAFSKALTIAENALVPSRKAEAFQFCRHHYAFFNHLVSKYYSFAPDLICQLAEDVDFKLLSSNKNVRWTSELISAYSGKWSWFSMNINDSLPWNHDFLRQFQGKIDWGRISTRQDLTWTTDIIAEFWSFFSSEAASKRATGIALSKNPLLPWSISFIERYIDYWDWKLLSKNPGLPWGPELIDRYAEKWKWWELSSNSGIPWSLGLIERYLNKLRFGREEEEGWQSLSLSSNICLPWSNELIERFLSKWDWYELSGNRGLPWSDELIRRYADKWNWDRLCANPMIFWTYDSIKEHENRVVLDNFSKGWCNNVAWSEKLIDEFETKLNWTSLSGNQNLPWSEKLLLKYEDRLSWAGTEESFRSSKGLSGNPSLPWSFEFINKYSDRIEWSSNNSSINLLSRWWSFSDNRGVNWTAKLIDLYWSNLDEDSLLKNETVWEKAFKPFVDDQFIRNIVAECKGNNLPEIICTVDNKEDIFRTAWGLYKNRQYDKSIIYFDAVLKYNPNNDSVRDYRARAYYFNRQYSEAIHDLTWLIGRQPETGELFLRRCNAFYRAGDLNMALKDVNTAAKLLAKSPRVYFHRGDIYASKREYQKAIDDFSHALDLSPNDRFALEHRAEAYEKLGMDRDAYSDLNTLVQKSDANYSIYSKRIKIAKRLKEYECVIADLTVLINQEPDVKENCYLYHDRAEMLCELHRWEEAIHDFHLAMVPEDNEDGGFEILVQECAVAHQKMGNSLAAEKEYRKLITPDGRIRGIKTESDLKEHLMWLIENCGDDFEIEIMQRLIEKLKVAG